VNLRRAVRAVVSLQDIENGLALFGHADGHVDAIGLHVIRRLVYSQSQMICI
jgi:hypothetical protein